MNVARLQELIALAVTRRAGVEDAAGDRRIRIEVSEGRQAAAPAERPALQFDRRDAAPAGTIVAPCYGIVHLTPAPGAPAFTRVGDVVAAGQRLCLIEAMKVFNPVTASMAGRVVEILVASGEEVGRGQAVLRLEPVGGA